MVIRGDGSDIDLLIEEGIKEMDAFIAVTGNSETNILSCLQAKKLGVKKTIAPTTKEEQKKVNKPMVTKIISVFKTDDAAGMAGWSSELNQLLLNL